VRGWRGCRDDQPEGFTSSSLDLMPTYHTAETGIRYSSPIVITSFPVAAPLCLLTTTSHTAIVGRRFDWVDVEGPGTHDERTRPHRGDRSSRPGLPER